MDVAAVHSHQQARTPVQEGLLNRVLHNSDDLKVAVPIVFLVLHGRLLDEACNTMYRLVAQRALPRGQLEGVRELILKVSGRRRGAFLRGGGVAESVLQKICQSWPITRVEMIGFTVFGTAPAWWRQ